MISVSYLKSAYSFEETINMLDRIDEVDFIHLDLMDGKYVDVNNFDIKKITDSFKNINKNKDVHLMVEDPIKYLDDLCKINPSIITFHPDASSDPMKTIKAIKEKNIKVGLALNINIDVEEFENLYKYADVILLMSVPAGYGGQPFQVDVLSKIEYFTNLKDEDNKFLLEIDGGITDEVYHKLQKYPIDIYVVGSYICNNENFKRPIEKLIK